LRRRKPVDADGSRAADAEGPWGCGSRLRSWEGLLLLILVATIAVNATMSPMFLTIGNQINLFQLSIEKIIVALMMALVIINGEIDLSVASMMGLAACAFGWLFQAGVPVGLAIPWSWRWGSWAAPSTPSGSPSSASRRWSSRSPC
jgi:predicted ABC-type sugar transport system permease subunit